MGKLLSFCSLDFYTIKPYRRSFVILLVVAIGMTVAFQSASTLCFYVMMCSVMMASYPFSIGESNRLETLYATLPLNRRDIVKGRYCFALCLQGAAAVTAITLAFVFSLVSKLAFVWQEIALYLCLASMIYSLMVAVQYPIYFRYGYNRAKLMAYVPLLLMVVVVVGIAALLEKLGLDVSVDDPALANGIGFGSMLALFVVLGLLLLAVSCLLCMRVYEKRDL